jgi:hypothetical protein
MSKSFQKIRIALALATALAAVSAQAVTTYAFTGTSVMTFDPAGCIPCTSGVPPPRTSPWIGSVTFDVDSDGTYELVPWTLAGAVNFEPTHGVSFSLTIEDGKIAAINSGFGGLSFSTTGLRFHHIEDYVGVQDAQATWNTTAPVPEPETWALMLAGVGLLLRRAKKGARP